MFVPRRCAPALGMAALWIATIVADRDFGHRFFQNPHVRRRSLHASGAWYRLATCSVSAVSGTLIRCRQSGFGVGYFVSVLRGDCSARCAGFDQVCSPIGPMCRHRSPWIWRLRGGPLASGGVVGRRGCAARRRAAGELGVQSRKSSSRRRVSGRVALMAQASATRNAGGSRARQFRGELWLSTWLGCRGLRRVALAIRDPIRVESAELCVVTAATTYPKRPAARRTPWLRLLAIATLHHDSRSATRAQE